MPMAFGFGIQAAAMVAYLAGRPDEAISLLSGSRRHGLHLRFEGASALGRRYLHRSRSRVSKDVAGGAAERGAALTIDQLVELARPSRTLRGHA